MIAGPGAPVTLLTEESERQIEALRRSLRRSKTFALHVIFAAGPARAEVLRRLRAWEGIGGIPELLWFLPGSQGAAAIDEFLSRAGREGESPAGAVIPDGDALFDAKGESQPLTALNLARDNLAAWIKGPLVLVIPASRAPDLVRVAPDLFDVRAMTVELEALQDEAMPPFPRSVTPQPFNESGASKAELHAEGARLRSLAASMESPPAGALAQAWLILGRAFYHVGELGEAKASAAEARQIAEDAGYTAGVAGAMMLEADVYDLSGQTEAWGRMIQQAYKLFLESGDVRGQASILARQARRNSRLRRYDEAVLMFRAASDLFEQSGEARNAATTRSEIAWVHWQRGELEDALRIEKEQLRVYERLGDVYGCALTMSHIATLYKARGEFEEALRIFRQEVLPICERTGAALDRALTMSQVAEIHLLREEHDEAIRVYSREVLPALEKVGASRNLGVARANLALAYLARNRPSDREEAAALLRLVHRAALELGLSTEAERIQALQTQFDLPLD